MREGFIAFVDLQDAPGDLICLVEVCLVLLSALIEFVQVFVKNILTHLKRVMLFVEDASFIPFIWMALLVISLVEYLK